MAAGHKYREELVATVKQICQPGKGILAADESTGTIEKRLTSVGLENNEENRRAYRELLFLAPGLNNYVSGVILFEETLKHGTKDGKKFLTHLKELGIAAGIKVDKGVKTLAGTDGETTTQGHDDLDKRCAAFYEQGCRFAKWRAVLKIGNHEPSELSIQENARGLARYAVICQENGLVPIVEPEVLMDGTHTIEQCAAASEKVFVAVTKALLDHNVFLEGMLLKPNMILPGAQSGKTATPNEVASWTLRTLQRTIVPAVPGIVFLSGGQGEEEATLNLNAINALQTKKPWFLTFSFARALQSSAIKVWLGKDENVAAARATLLARAKANSEAQLAKYAGGVGGNEANTSLFEGNYRY
jgi:fructose-bisphosphate aldolase class I